MHFRNRSVNFLLSFAAIALLSYTAEKCRKMVGEERASQSGKFTLLDCFDMSSGTVACAAKEGVKLYSYNMRTAHVETMRNRAIEASLSECMSRGVDPKDAAKRAQKDGAEAAKLATRQAKRVAGPIISSGWDFFEAMYYGGTSTEALLRACGTLYGTYVGGFLAEQRLGYLVGSHLGSWVGGWIGLIIYDLSSGLIYYLVT